MLDLLTVGSKFTRPARRATAAAIDRFLLPAPPTAAANPPAATAAVDRRDRQTDRRTDTRPIYDAHRRVCAPRKQVVFAGGGRTTTLTSGSDYTESMATIRSPF